MVHTGTVNNRAPSARPYGGYTEWTFSKVVLPLEPPVINIVVWQEDGRTRPFGKLVFCINQCVSGGATDLCDCYGSVLCGQNGF